MNMAYQNNGWLKRALRLLMAMLATIVLASCGITAPRGDEGYAHLDSPGMLELDNQRTTALSIGPTVLRLAAHYLDDDPDVKVLLKSLNGVRVIVYEVDGDSESVSRNLQHLVQTLQSDHWLSVLLVHEDGEHTQMFAKSSARGVQGLTIISQDEHEVTLINVMGEIDPVHFKDVMVALNVDDAPEARVASAN